MAIDPNSEPNQASFHIWETRTGDEEGSGTDVGHISVALQGRNSNGRYFSFGPRHAALVNPLTLFFPTAGKVEPNLDSDMKNEGRAPDRTLQTEITEEQLEAMVSEANRLDEQAQEGTLLYHLFPNTSVLPLLKLYGTRTAHQEAAKCPFSGRSMKDYRHESWEKLQNVKEGHCASTVHQIASQAWDLPEQNSTPWGIHPTQLGDQLERVIEG